MRPNRAVAAKPLKRGVTEPGDASHRDYERLAEAFGVLAHPVRLRILEVLMSACTCTPQTGKCCVQDIHTRLDLPQPVVSKHLKILKELDILSYERVANKIYYSFTQTNPASAVSPAAKSREQADDNLLQEIFSYISACCKCC